MPQENKDWKEAWKIQWSRGNVTNLEMPEDFKAFIQSLLDKQRSEIIKLIEGNTVSKYEGVASDWTVDEVNAYNYALDEILTEIKKGDK